MSTQEEQTKKKKKDWRVKGVLAFLKKFSHDEAHNVFTRGRVSINPIFAL